LKRVLSNLKRRGWSVELKVTAKPGDAIALARAAAAARRDAAIVAGGDGTVNEAVNGLVGTDTALGVLPIGTGNLWAKQLGVPTYTLTNPLRLRDAAEGLVEGTLRSIDVGKVDNRHFLCWAGIGLDAQVTSEMEPRQRRTKRLGALPYLIALALVARDFKGVRSRVTLDGSVIRSRTLLILASNIQQYCGLPVVRDAYVDDGLLDVFVFKGLGFQYAARHVMKLLSQRHLQDPRVVHQQARRIEIQTEWATPVQADGDPIGTTPTIVSVAPRALRVLVPPSAPDGLFSSAA
jgi:YegS/Rv2252/BmrU family lipid kinase